MNQRIINQITRTTWINKIKRLRYYPNDNFNIPINIMTSIINSIIYYLSFINSFYSIKRNYYHYVYC